MYRFFPPPAGPRCSSRRGPDDVGRGLYGVLIGCYLLGIRLVFFSERDIVVLRFRRRRRRPGSVGRPAARPAEELDVVRHDLDLAPLYAVGLPAPLPEAPLDQDGTALGKVLGAILARLPEHRDVEEGDLFLDLVVCLVAAIHRDAETGHGNSGREKARLRIPHEVAGEYDTVEGDHRDPPCPARQASAGAAGASGAGVPESVGASPAGGAAASAFGASVAVCRVVR